MAKVLAPWTADQVASLNAYQTAGYVHPFTSNAGGVLGEGLNLLNLGPKINLIATVEGWVVDIDGPVVQTWTHDFMCDWSWRIPEFDNPNTEDMR